jgi:hypothetical protein
MDEANFLKNDKVNMICDEKNPKLQQSTKFSMTLVACLVPQVIQKRYLVTQGTAIALLQLLRSF